MVSAVFFERFRLPSNTGFTNYSVLTVPNSNLAAIDHQLFESPHDADVLLAYANFYGSFWKGAPARRGVLLTMSSSDPRPFSTVYPKVPIPTMGGVQYFNRDAAESAILLGEVDSRPLQFMDGRIVGGNPAYMAILDRMCDERRAFFFPAGNRDVRTKNDGLNDIGISVAMSTYGDRLSRHSSEGFAFNSGFFVWTDEEFIADPTARVPDPIGLTIQSGQILTPPIYRRPALVFHGNPRTASIIKVSIADCTINVAGEEFPGSRALSRVSARSGPLPAVAEGSARLVVSGAAVVGLVADAATAHPPGGGFFLDVPDSVAARALTAEPHVKYSIPALRGTWAACQGSIELIRHGRLVDLGKESTQLDLPLRGGIVGEIPPNHLTPLALLGKSLARTAVGISKDGSLVVLHAEGTESRSLDPAFDSEGSAMSKIAMLLLDYGCTDALAFDGGGSAALAESGRLLTRPADRFDVRHLPRERIIPGGWLVQEHN